jgi:hypothetical protein
VTKPVTLKQSGRLCLLPDPAASFGLVSSPYPPAQHRCTAGQQAPGQFKLIELGVHSIQHTPRKGSRHPAPLQLHLESRTSHGLSSKTGLCPSKRIGLIVQVAETLKPLKQRREGLWRGAFSEQVGSELRFGAVTACQVPKRSVLQTIRTEHGAFHGEAIFALADRPRLI